MLKDKIILAGMAGFFGILADELVEWTAFLLNISDSMTIRMIAKVIYSTHQLNVIQLITGEIAHLIAGFILGIIPFVFYLWSGKKYPIVKGVGIGAGLWLNHAVLIPSLVDHRIHLMTTTSTLIVELIGIILWGIVSYSVIAKYGHQITQPTH